MRSIKCVYHPVNCVNGANGVANVDCSEIVIA